MPPSIALLVWLTCLILLWRFDPAKISGTSWALWVPLIWMFIVATRLPSQWLGGQSGQSAEDLQEGNPIDRTILFVFILLAILILNSRAINWSSLFRLNVPLALFLIFALLSFLWSDYPFVTIKRWIRDLGNYLVILVVLTDPRPQDALRTVLRRLGYVLVPLSILLIKYFPEMSKSYDVWSGKAFYVGATTSKNMLGLVCLVTGLFFFWDIVALWGNRKIRGVKRVIAVDLVFSAMTLWLMQLAGSATSNVCFVVGCGVVIASHLKFFRRNPKFLRATIPTVFCTYAILALGFNINAQLASAVGRDPTLTDRTKIWQVLLSANTNPIIGTGYQSFWLGERLDLVWRAFPGVNEAHNGYLDVYLNLGLVGVALLITFLLTTYAAIFRRLKYRSDFASFTLAVWSMLILYNLTEAAFQAGLLWMLLMAGTVTVQNRAGKRLKARSNVERPFTPAHRQTAHPDAISEI